MSSGSKAVSLSAEGFAGHEMLAEPTYCEMSELLETCNHRLEAMTPWPGSYPTLPDKVLALAATVREQAKPPA